MDRTRTSIAPQDKRGQKPGVVPAEQHSPAMVLVQHVWDHCGEKGRDSYRTLNGSMHSAVTLAITSGMAFGRDDFTYFANRFRLSYWGTNDGHMLGEGFYAAASKADNLSACQSFEAWKGRRPFVVRGDVCGTGNNGRVYVGKDLLLATGKGGRVERWSVTSFSEDGDAFVAVVRDYERDDEGYHRRTKVKKRRRIDREQFAELHAPLRTKERAKRAAVRDRLGAAYALRKAGAWFKVLHEGRSCSGGDFTWSLPTEAGGTWTPGDWAELPAHESVEMCVRGFHITRSPHLWMVPGATTYLVEIPDDVLRGSLGAFARGDDKSVVRKCRLVRPLTPAELAGLEQVPATEPKNESEAA